MQDAPDSNALERRGWGATFAALSDFHFRLLWITTVFSSAGNWIQQVTLSWLAFDLTGSPVQVALVLACRTLPMLSSPLAGALADRFDRKRILVLDHMFMVVVATGFAADILTNHIHIWHMYVFSFVAGAAWAVNNPVRQSLVANSAPRHMLTNAIALNSMAFNSMRMIGPAIGGGLIAWFGPGWNFMIQAIMYVFVLIAIFPYKALYGTARPASNPRFLEGIGQGFRYLLSTPVALATTCMSFIATFAMMSSLTSQMAVFAAQDLNDPTGSSLGLLLGAMGVGGFLGTVALARFSGFSRKGWLSISGGVGGALGMLAVSQTHNLPMAAAALIFQQFFFMTVMTTSNVIVQSTVPDEYRGRVMGVYMLNVGFQPLGGVIAGLLAAAFSVPFAWVVGGVMGITGVSIVTALVPSFRRFRLAS